MSPSKQELLSRIESQAAPTISSRVRSLLKSNGVRSTSSTPVHAAAKELVSVWETRLNNSQSTGKPIQGAQSLIDRLRQIPPEAKVEQFGFIGNAFSGSLFFDSASGEFLGDTVVSRSIQSKLQRPNGLSPARRQAKSA
jgi:hypothetical protein